MIDFVYACFGVFLILLGLSVLLWVRQWRDNLELCRDNQTERRRMAEAHLETARIQSAMNDRAIRHQRRLLKRDRGF